MPAAWGVAAKAGCAATSTTICDDAVAASGTAADGSARPAVWGVAGRVSLGATAAVSIALPGKGRL